MSSWLFRRGYEAILLKHVGGLVLVLQLLDGLSGLGWVSLLSSLDGSDSYDFGVNSAGDAVLEFHVDLWDVEFASLVHRGFSNISLS